VRVGDPIAFRVPMTQLMNNRAAYKTFDDRACVTSMLVAMEALSRGTLFPGLDLPFMGMVNQTQEVTPLTEMMALCFVAHELALYLDTHQDDAEAFAMYQSFLALKKEARERYVKQCGPVTHADMLGMERYAWLDDPWPWDYDRQREG